LDLVAHLGSGFVAAFTAANLFYCLVGVVLGTLIGVLPGLGPNATIAMLLPFTFTLEPLTALIMLAGIYYGAQYGGSTTAILIKVPGEASSVVTALDGYQMGRRGRAGAALAAAAIGSFVAGTFATLLVALLGPPLASVALAFGPADYCSLIVLGLVASVVLAEASLLKAFGMIALGLLLGLVGSDVNSGVERFTFGFPELADGIPVAVVAMGLFGLGEIVHNLRDEHFREPTLGRISGLFPTKDDLHRIIGPIVRGTLLGSILGILPGGGSILASFAAYSLERKISRNKDEFGNGAIEGVAGPEAANNAGAQTSFIPMLTLGLPANSVMALMLGAMIIHGIVPGPSVMVEQPTLFYGLVASMWIGNLFLVVLNLPMVGLWVRLLSIPYYLLFPMIVAFCCIGAFSLRNNVFDVYLMAGFGLLGTILVALRCELAPLLLGFVLGPMFEEYLRRALILSRGDPTIFVTRPISAALLALAFLALVAVLVPSVRRLGGAA
jgi:putative tricarboxylic transport membrane protein